ncbi:MAG: ATP synthase F1 subunit gamma [Candidatus Omnitrophota bacterium]|jgi:F-type H+-transporting ATPase subunit gamma
MAQSLKRIKSRLRSIENTRKVTGAMQMISATKLHRTTKVLMSAKPYLLKLESLLNNIASGPVSLVGPFFTARPEVKRIALCLVTSDGGLCGAYNNNIIRVAEDFIEKYGRDRIRLIAVGQKGYKYFRSLGIIASNPYLGLNGRYVEPVADDIGHTLIDSFLNNEVDEVHIAYTHFETVLRVRPVVVKFLNIERAAGSNAEYIFEPNVSKIIEELVPRYLLVKIRCVLLDSLTSEHSARTVAMKAATDNAGDLLHSLTQLRNKVRQANITQEIMEIISSVEALKG